MEITSEFIHNNQYSLSIRFSSDGFSLCIYDEVDHLISKKTVSQSLFLLKEKAIYDLIAKEVETQLEFKNIRLICESDIYTLIPNVFFTPEMACDFLYFEREKSKNESELYSQLPVWENTLIYSLPTHLQNAIKRVYPNKHIEHHLTSFLSKVANDRNASGLKIWTRSKMLDVALITNGKLTLLNSYTYNTPEDYTFFVLNIFEQLSLDIETCKVDIYNLENNSEIKNLLQKYVKELIVID
ncbi:MAG: DUF3822 family protein [Paludibacter sp.]|nr:DUF3822 family protein [Paludibacter sp.]